MRQARAQVVAGAVQENLGFVFQAAEGARVDDAVAVALVLRAPFRRRLGIFSPARIGAELGEGREDFAFELFEVLARAGHANQLMRDGCAVGEPCDGPPPIWFPTVRGRKFRAIQTTGGWSP